MLPFAIQFAPGEPVYEQVILAAKRAIASGLMRPGDRFPSVRQLAQELKINPNTAQKATAHLVDLGLLEIHPGIETVVRELPEMEPSEKLRWLQQTAARLAVEAASRRISPDEFHRALDEAFETLTPDSHP
jgi:DNA-binding transcriptional regulator YhcF (GntR family)